MALSPVHAVLYNAELLGIILERIPRRDMPSVRLCNSAFHDTASPFLFRNLLLSSRKRHLRRLRFLLSHEQFIRGAREVIWEAVTYGTGSPNTVHLLHGGGLCFERVKRVSSLGCDESALWRNEQSRMALVELLTTAFRVLKGIKHVAFTFWHGGENGDRNFRESTTASGITTKKMPPPLLSFLDADLLALRQTKAFASILRALGDSDCALQSFTMAPGVIDTSTSPGFEQYPWSGFRGMLVTFRHMDHRALDMASKALRHLTKLHLDFKETDIRPVMDIALHNRLGSDHDNDGLASILKSLENLTDLFVRLAPSQYENSGGLSTSYIPLKRVFNSATYPKLHTLGLDTFWLTPGELCTFLNRHGDSLRELTLADINLGGTPDDLQVLHDSFQPFTFTYTPKNNEWQQVAQTCQELPKLKGLKIDGPSSSRDWDVLSLFDAEDLEEEGMNGRENVLVCKRDDGAWDTLDRLFL